MRLMDVEFDKLATVRIKCIENGSQKAVIKWRNLYPLEAVTGDAETKGFYFEVLGDQNFRYYTLWNDCEGLFAVNYKISPNENHDVSELAMLAKNMEEFKGAEGYKKRQIGRAHV